MEAFKFLMLKTTTANNFVRFQHITLTYTCSQSGVLKFSQFVVWNTEFSLDVFYLILLVNLVAGKIPL